MAATYDNSTDRGKVRLKIGDTDVTPASDAVFDDSEIDVFLELETTVNSAAAAALEAVAAGSSKLPVILRSLNFSKNTAFGRQQLLALATRLRETDPDTDALGFAGAEVNLTDANALDIRINRALRDQ